MGPEEIYPLIRQSVVQLKFDDDQTTCGIIIACKSESAYVIADACNYTQGDGFHVEFEDGQIVYPTEAECYEEDGILGIHCSGIGFNQNLVKKFDILEKTEDVCVEVYVYDREEEALTEGYATKVDPYHYNLTNISTFHSQYGSPVVEKDGRLIAMCSSFEHHLTARDMVSIASSIERSHNRIFTTVTDTIEYLDTII